MFTGLALDCLQGLSHRKDLKESTQWCQAQVGTAAQLELINVL